MTDVNSLLNDDLPDGLSGTRRLLEENGLSTRNWENVTHNGYSGATILKHSTVEGRQFVLKVTSKETDLIMQLTRDEIGREVSFANAQLDLGQGIRVPTLGATRDGTTCAILMRDISGNLLSNCPVTRAQFDAIVVGMQRLHARPVHDADALPWCPVGERLTIFRPDPARLGRFRITQRILDGWKIFFETAPEDVVRLVQGLFEDPAPIEAALAPLPSVLLHGDLKIDNIGLDEDGTMHLIDWSMPLRAPAAIDLGWFLAMNSRNIPVSLPEAMAAYSAGSGIDGDLLRRHESLAALCGLLIRGWRKALDAHEGVSNELDWWCEHALRARRFLNS